MNGIKSPPSLDKLKQQAKMLRVEHEAGGGTISHSRSLELLAHKYGYKDWNTLHAAVGNRPVGCPVSLGQRVMGTYLGQAFRGEVKGIKILGSNEYFRVTLVFDEAVDVITFESMTNFRKQVFCVIGVDGKTVEKTSNGEPQLTLNLEGVLQ